MAMSPSRAKSSTIRPTSSTDSDATAEHTRTRFVPSSAITSNFRSASSNALARFAVGAAFKIAERLENSYFQAMIANHHSRLASLASIGREVGFKELNGIKTCAAYG